MAKDVNLLLDSGSTIVADGNSVYVECEGGFLAWARMYWGAMSGAASTCDARVMVSVDGGSNYYMKGKFQQVGPTDDNKEDCIPVYIPQPTTKGTLVRVRINYDVAGAAPSYAVTNCFLDPMTSLGVEANDEQAKIGAASLISAV